MEKSVYLPGLNGIRAIAALGVMVSHINLDLVKFNIFSFSLFGFNASNLPKSWNLGEQGVTMFFVLSGFLITYLLVLERKKKDTINIRNFYLRRILRIWPLYYFYLFLCILIYFLFTKDLPSISSTSFYIFLLANIPFIIGETIPICAHLWSIAVEEQFYLFWPHFFRKNTDLRKLLILIICVCIVIRVALWALFPFKFFTILFTVNRFDCMIYGGLVALTMHHNNHTILNYINSEWTQMGSWFVIAVHILNMEFINSIISMELVMIATGLIICGQIYEKNRVVNLENKLFNFLGRYSFGIYVYHPLLIFLLSKTEIVNYFDTDIYKSLFVFSTIITGTIIIAVLSHELLEKRFIKLKGKFSIVNSTNNPS